MIKTDSEFLSKAIDLVAEYTDEHLDKSDGPVEYKVFVVWYCKTLQKLQSIALYHSVLMGMYYEVTYNGDKGEVYLDAYKKFENERSSCKEVSQWLKFLLVVILNGLSKLSI